MKLQGRPCAPARLLTVLAVVAVMLAGGCGGMEPGMHDEVRGQAPDVYVVRSGDTLFSIARRFGLDHRDIARRNQLGDGTLIYPGQRLRLGGAGDSHGRGAAAGEAGSAQVPPPGTWQWPTAGNVVLGFGQSPKTASGVLITGKEGQAVIAAADGEVVYSGSGLAGYGQLIIIRHNPSWLSAYGYNRNLLVQEGNRVRAGQEIARMGDGGGYKAALHFEIRRDGAPVDPLRYLPVRR